MNFDIEKGLSTVFHGKFFSSLAVLAFIRQYATQTEANQTRKFHFPSSTRSCVMILSDKIKSFVRERSPDIRLPHMNY